MAQEESADLSVLANYPFIHYSGKAGLKLEINKLFQKVNAAPRVCGEFEEEMAIARMVASEMGFAIVPYNPFLKNYKVKISPIGNPAYSRTIYLGSIKNRKESPSIQRFKKYVIEHSERIMQSEVVEEM